MPPENIPSYWDYLRVHDLLSLQGGLDDDEDKLMTDELHFIVVHQVFELWFKLVLRELRLARDHLGAPEVPEETIPHVVHHLGRVNEILRLSVEQFRVMETLTPQDFLAFRDKLIPASGFQSVQMREIEILLGLEDAKRVPLGDTDALRHLENMTAGTPEGARAWQRIQDARAEDTLRDSVREWLYRTPIQGSGPDDKSDDQTVTRFLEDYLDVYRKQLAIQFQDLVDKRVGQEQDLAEKKEANETRAREFLFALEESEPDRAKTRRVRAGLLFIESYRELPLLAWPRLLIDTIVELEQNLILFRSRHARTVERTIGRRIGTGGSSGVDYLDRTTQYRVYPELWEIRSLLLPRSVLPPVTASSGYGFEG